jgi:hypothetical protein
MKSVGEAMGIGGRSLEAVLKAMRSRELDSVAAAPWRGLEDFPTASTLVPGRARPRGRQRSRRPALDDLVADDWLVSSGSALDARCRRMWDDRGSERAPPARLRRSPVYRRVDSCAARWRRLQLLLLGLGRGGRGGGRRAALSSSSARARTGSARASSSTTAASTPRAFRELGSRRVMVNCNPRPSPPTTTPPTGSTSSRSASRKCWRSASESGRRASSSSSAARRRSSSRVRSSGRLPHPRHAVRGRRPRRGSLSASVRSSTPLGIRCPEWGIGRIRTRRSQLPTVWGTRCWFVPRTYWAGARCASATRPEDVRDAWRTRRAASSSTASSRMPSRSTSTRLCDGEETYVAAVMQHVEEAGVHSGDSSCVLRRRRSPRGNGRDPRDRFRARAGARRRRVLNVQLAVATGTFTSSR